MNDTVAAFMAALAETEWLDAERLWLYQRRLLERLLRHARAETDFYPDRLALLFRADDFIDWDRWEEVPILTRAQAQDSFAALAARSLVPVAGKPIEETTSGSTGRPFRHYTTDIQTTAAVCANERFFRWHDIDPNRLMAFIRSIADPGAAYPHGSTWKGWRLGYPDSPARSLTVMGTPVDRQVEWLSRVRPDYLLSYPSNLAEIARVGAAAGEHFDVRAVMTYGEALSPDAEAEIQDFFGHAPLDRYGATEVALMACTCPSSRKRHVMAELVLLEIVDENGRPCPPGTAGRVVVTPFYNHAMPLVRYDIGDYAVMAVEPCSCGRSLPALDAIHGRARNIFRFKDGTSQWPTLGARRLQKLVPHRQAQLVQMTYEQLEYRYVPLDPHQQNDEAGLTELLRSRLHSSVQVRLVAVDAIPRSANGKFEESLSLVK